MATKVSMMVVCATIPPTSSFAWLARLSYCVQHWAAACAEVWWVLTSLLALALISVVHNISLFKGLASFCLPHCICRFQYYSNTLTANKYEGHVCHQSSPAHWTPNFCYYTHPHTPTYPHTHTHTHTCTHTHTHTHTHPHTHTPTHPHMQNS